jgi:hypothetical protein
VFLLEQFHHRRFLGLAENNPQNSSPALITLAREQSFVEKLTIRLNR